MEFHAITVDAFPIDEQLTDRATVGPETAALAHGYLATPRALIWHNPSSEWRLFVLLVPLASRLSLMRNPIFTQLVRDWGMSVRFVGVDADQRVFDFRRLLSDRTLGRLVDALAVLLNASSPSANAALDVLFAALADSMLTILQEREPDWPRHLDREHRLEPGVPGSLFERASRYPDFLKSLQGALRDETIDVAFYTRALRSMDLREENAERRIASIIESVLDARWLDVLRDGPTGQHLGCYNWLLDRPNNAAQRQYALARLPGFAQVFADILAGETELATPATGPARTAPVGDLSHAVDSGQDRLIIGQLARRFRIGENTMRSIWRLQPPLGMPPAWQLGHILRHLDATAARNWPSAPQEWEALVARALPHDLAPPGEPPLPAR